MQRTLSFWTTGENFTNLVRTFIDEGQIAKVAEILKALPAEIIKGFFEGKYKFEGDTRDGKDLQVVEDDSNSFNIDQCIRSIVLGEGKTLAYLFKYSGNKDAAIEAQRYDALEAMRYSENKDIEALKLLFDTEELIRKYRYLDSDVIHADGEYDVLTVEIIKQSTRTMSGCILPNGDFVRCADTNGHSSLYSYLYRIGAIKVDDWTRCYETIHVSYNRISGRDTTNLVCGLRTENFTDAQLETLFQLRNTFRFYDNYAGEDDIICKSLLKTNQTNLDLGAKYSNLKFLQKFESNLFKLPQIDIKPIQNVQNCIRTSPRYSLAGILDSKFDLQPSQYEAAISDIFAKYEAFKDLVSDNKLTVFYQEQLDGRNGVFNVDEKGKASFAISDNRGDVVNGKETEAIHLSDRAKLQPIAELFFAEFKSSLQCEFVIVDETVYVVQLRLMKPQARDIICQINDENKSYYQDFNRIYLRGKAFCIGSVKAKSSEILVVKDDCDSSELIGKKALIVEADTEFSHILALSKNLGIPSMSAVGEVLLLEGKEFYFISCPVGGGILELIN